MNKVLNKRVYNFYSSVLMFYFPFIFVGFLLGMALATEDSSKIGIVIGIDLGTRYSRVSVYNNGYVHMIPNDLINRITTTPIMGCIY